MSVTAYKAVWANSEAKGTARLVLLALAEHVNEKAAQAGGPLEAWPSQETLARMCNCQRTYVGRALASLEALGEVADTGRRQKHGNRVYALKSEWVSNLSTPKDSEEKRVSTLSQGVSTQEKQTRHEPEVNRKEPDTPISSPKGERRRRRRDEQQKETIAYVPNGLGREVERWSASDYRSAPLPILHKRLSLLEANDPHNERELASAEYERRAEEVAA